jgi:hypothetical protein
VLTTAVIALVIEHFALDSHALSGLTEHGIKQLHASAMPPTDFETLRGAIGNSFADGFTSGALIMHVLMSQVIFVVLNILHALKNEHI